MHRKRYPVIFPLMLPVLILMVSCPVSGADVSPPAGNLLRLLIWPEYVEPDLIKAFEKKFAASVKQIHYETDELKDELLIESGGKGYDVVLTSGIAAVSYVKRQWLLPIGSADVPNLKHIDPKWLEAHPQIRGYAVPYLWGTLGIGFRKDLIRETVSSWNQLLRPAEYLRNRIIMIKDSRDIVGAALKGLGYSINSEAPQHYEEAERLLLAQKPFVQIYSYITLTRESALVTGKASMAMVYNGDALVLKEYHPQIAYVVPEEGTSLWIDYLVVMKASQNKALSLQFINFLNEPKNAARLAAHLMYATPNKAAEKFLPPDHLKHPAIYPAEAVLEKSELPRELSPRIMRKRNSVFINVIR